MTTINLCCYHCGQFSPDKKKVEQCLKGESVCFKAYMSVMEGDATYRKDCTRIDSECKEYPSHSCFERRKGNA